MQLFVIGAGYVGLTTAIGFAELGHVVSVHDIDQERLAMLSEGRSPIFELGVDAALRRGLADGLLRFTSAELPSAETDIAIVCVPTPFDEAGLLSTTIVEAVVARLLAAMGPSRTIVVRSTMPLHGPERLEALAGDRGDRPSIVVNPEFLREGRALADFAAPSRVVVGALASRDRRAAQQFGDLYAPLGAQLIVTDARSAALVKLASNVFLGAKVAFADELARLCDATGADVTVVADGVGLDPRIGRAFLDAGPGFGGSCLPEQAMSIAAETSRRGMSAPFLSSIATSNATHQEALVSQVGELLPAGLDGARVGLLGLAFKANTDDVRRSPALALAAGLRQRGATVVGFDPVAAAAARAADPALLTAASAIQAAAGADGLVVATEWPEFGSLDWSRLAATMRGDLVYDVRRIVDAAAVRAAGLRYVALGRASSSADGDVPDPPGAPATASIAAA
ncbi:MAG TPA: nucleotide sugar dehydrogenase [Candidatus Dormibacteraeota bacterium]|nr:nucleotide sugar dehydrogenase [Candidatus Dormibacteraeota bacterium]